MDNYQRCDPLISQWKPAAADRNACPRPQPPLMSVRRAGVHVCPSSTVLRRLADGCGRRFSSAWQPLQQGKRTGAVGLEKALVTGGRKAEPLPVKRVLVVTKTTRFQDEATRISGKPSWQDVLADPGALSRLETLLASEGFDVQALKKSHAAQEASVQRILGSLDAVGVKHTRVSSGESFAQPPHTNGLDHDHESVGDSLLLPRMITQRGSPSYGTPSGCDLIISAGGDGTFLKAALNNNGSIPQLGINTDPQRSRGKLCAHTCYEDDADSLADIIRRLRAGDYQWRKRSRLEIRLRKVRGLEGAACDAAGQGLREWEGGGQFGPELEWLALNEVFVGERDPCRASVLSCSADRYNDGVPVRLKCSGLLVCTGTGSPAWAAEVNRVRHHHVRAVLRGLEQCGLPEVMPAELRGGLEALMRLGTEQREAMVRTAAEAANSVLEQQALPPHAAWLQLLVREPIMAGDVSDYLLDRLPVVRPAGASARSGRGAQQRANGVEGLGKQDMAGEGEVAEEEGRPKMRRVGGAALRKVIKVSSVGQDTVLMIDGRIRIPLMRGWEAELRVAPQDKSLWTFSFG